MLPVSPPPWQACHPFQPPGQASARKHTTTSRTVFAVHRSTSFVPCSATEPSRGRSQSIHPSLDPAQSTRSGLPCTRPRSSALGAQERRTTGAQDHRSAGPQEHTGPNTRVHSACFLVRMPMDFVDPIAAAGDMQPDGCVITAELPPGITPPDNPGALHWDRTFGWLGWLGSLRGSRIEQLHVFAPQLKRSCPWCSQMSGSNRYSWR
ncbi:hypothetical protein EV126DRAFT_145622 [Verticillium dahliae]|nr:hypothetical protein EV126DRAFT_219715 [Verticillium dahliae]KAH6685202.1 hypothetical protein EV126DRAFT_145622 [Verticillium dahliae]